MTNRMDAALWDDYQTTRSDSARNAIFERHYSRIHEQVERILETLGKGPLCDDILSHVAEHVLTVTIPKFDTGSGHSSFRGHLFYHVLRATLEALRSGDQRSRWLSEQQARVSEGRRKRSNDLGRRATDAEVAEHMGVSELDVIRAIGQPEVQVEAISACNDPEDYSTLLDGLDPDQKSILRLYFEHGHSQAEIAKIIGIDQSAVSRRMTTALDFLRPQLIN